MRWTFFYLAFSNIESTETFSSIPIAVIENDNFKENEIYRETIKSLSNKENNIFDTKYVDNEEEGLKLLNNNSVIGYLILKNNPKIVIKKNGTSETIFKQIIDEIWEKSKTIENLIKIEISNKNTNIEAIHSEITQKVLTELNTDNIKDISTSKLSYTVVEFYTLIAMTCLYGGILTMYMMNKCLANMSNNGKRIGVSSISKAKLILSSLLSSFTVTIIGLALLLIFITFILKIDFGKSIILVILLTLVGAFAGLSLGTITSVIFKTNENTKMGIIIGITMFGCFLSGMMGITMKYLIDKNAPIINKLNPVAMITDGFYSLYYYETLDRFIFNIISLIILSITLLFISYLSLRRQNYDSI